MTQPARLDAHGRSVGVVKAQLHLDADEDGIGDHHRGEEEVEALALDQPAALFSRFFCCSCFFVGGLQAKPKGKAVPQYFWITRLFQGG